MRTLTIAFLLTTPAFAAEWMLDAPLPHQVVQRTGYVPSEAHEHAVGGPKLGYADVLLKGPVPPDAAGSLKYSWTTIGKDSVVTSKEVTPTIEAGRFSATIRLPAGWHRLEIEWSTAKTKIDPLGVGEVLVIAGQSYAAGANDELLKVSDPQERVSAFDPDSGQWRVAHDPQPIQGDGGTIWPPLGDMIAGTLNVPVGFVNVASGGTSSRQWLPGTPLYQRLSKSGQTIGAFRAVLWQQGESDVIENVTIETYVANLRTIRTQLAAEWKRDVPWLLAKSTLHPTVYNWPDREGAIRSAIARLQAEPGFGPGPDTDTLGGENRGGPSTRRHFSGIGQRHAALLWYTAVWNEIHRAPHGEPGSPRMVQFEGDRRCLVWGDKPARPAPLLLVFAGNFETMTTLPIYTEVGRRLTADGFVVAAIEPPCHGFDHQPGEQPDLAGWPGRCQGEDKLVGPFVERTRGVLDALIAQGYADPERVAVAGTSRGGFCAFQFAAAEPRVKAAVGFGPVTNLLALSEFAGQDDNPVVKQLGLIHLAEKLANRPLWFSIGNNDARVNTDDAIAFARAVAQASAKRPESQSKPIPVEFFIGASVGHRTPDHAHEQAAAFIRKHVHTK